MKIVTPTLRPRNPQVTPSHFRRAGSHRPGPHSQRQRAGRVLKRELTPLTHRD